MNAASAAAGVAGSSVVPRVTRRRLLTASATLATLLYTVDTTIANVSLPHIQAGLQTTRDQIVWVLTSYIVSSAIATPLFGFLAVRFGMRRILIGAVAGFTIASMLCGLAGSLGQLVVFRVLQGVFGAALVPLSLSALLDAYPKERHGMANAIWSVGVMVGPLIGPTLGGFLTEGLGWRWIFFVNAPIGLVAVLGLLASLPRDELRSPRPFDLKGFLFLALALGALQLALDRGQGEGWFESGEILAEVVAGTLLLYMFVVHILTTPRSFIAPAMFRDWNFSIGLVAMFCIGLLVVAPMAMIPTLLQQVFAYPVIDAGLLLAPRGLGTMITAICVGHLLTRIDARFIAAGGLLVLAIGLWPMARLSPDTDAWIFGTTAFVQGIGLGMLFVPISTLAFGTLAAPLRTEGSVLLSLQRNLGSAVGVSIFATLLTRFEAVNQAQLVERLSPFDAQSWSTVERVAGDQSTALLAAEVARQASLIAYADDFAVLLALCVLCAPVFLMFRAASSRGEKPPPAAVD